MRILLLSLALLTTSFSLLAQDSIRFVHAYEKADTTTRVAIKKLDSIRTETESGSIRLKTKYDSVLSITTQEESRLQHKIDSLTTLRLPTDGLVGRLDSVRQAKVDQVNQFKGKWEGLKGKANSAVNDLQLPPPWDEGQKQVSSAINQLNFDLPAEKLNLPELEWSKSLDLNFPDWKDPLGNLSLNKSVLPSLNSDVLKQAGQYKNQIGDLSKGNPDKLVDGEVGKLEEARILKEQTGLMNDQLALDAAKDAQAAKAQYISMARKAAMKQFEGQFDQVDKAMDMAKKYKKKFPNVESARDMPEKIPNEMKGKPLRERLVWALALQLQQQRDWMLDVNPSLGYRFSGRIIGGLGWNQRIAYNFKTDDWVHKAFIQGPRVYGEYFLTKGGVALRLESDYMKTKINYYNPYYVSELQAREWVWGMMVGLRKVYRINKKISGNLQALYNIYDPDNRSPYSRFNLRIGFEFGKRK